MQAKKNSKLEKAAQLYSNARLYDDNDSSDSSKTFIDGAEWAIDEVCRYLKSKRYQQFAGGPFERVISDEDIKELREKILS